MGRSISLEICPLVNWEERECFHRTYKEKEQLIACDPLTHTLPSTRRCISPIKTSRSVSSVPWITPEIRRQIRRKNITHAKAKKTGSAKIRSKFENLRREIKADIRKQHDLYVNNLVGDVMANPRDFYRYINSQRKDTQGILPLKKKN